MLSVFVKGVLLGISLIVVIGPQNAFVIRQGLLKSHILSVVIICLACDIVVMGASVFGVGGLLGVDSGWFLLLGVLGVVFLLYYAFGAFRSAIATLRSPESHSGFQGDLARDLRVDSNVDSAPESSTCARSTRHSTRSRAITTTLALTLLNPNFYLDTLVIIGGVSATLLDSAAKLAFFAGLIGVSFAWYFGIGYGVRILLPLFQSQRAWAVLDGFTGLVMCGLSYYLLAFLWGQLAWRFA